MFSPIVRSASPITLVGGGQATRRDLQKALTLAPICAAVDGGAALALRAGVLPDVVIGDFDSVPAEVLDQIPSERRHRIAEQESTDFEKALRRVVAPVVIGVGFLGGRVDHQLAVFHTLAAVPERPCVLLGRTEVVCLLPPQLHLPTRAGDVVSLFPLGSVTGRSTGLKWPIDGLAFDPMTRIGTSNAATGPIIIDTEGPALLGVFPRRLMPALVAALATPDVARWPARAG